MPFTKSSNVRAWERRRATKGPFDGVKLALDPEIHRRMMESDSPHGDLAALDGLSWRNHYGHSALRDIRNGLALALIDAGVDVSSFVVAVRGEDTQDTTFKTLWTNSEVREHVLACAKHEFGFIDQYLKFVSGMDRLFRIVLDESQTDEVRTAAQLDFDANYEDLAGNSYSMKWRTFGKGESEEVPLYATKERAYEAAARFGRAHLAWLQGGAGYALSTAEQAACSAVEVAVRKAQVEIDRATTAAAVLAARTAAETTIATVNLDGIAPQWRLVRSGGTNPAIPATGKYTLPAATAGAYPLAVGIVEAWSPPGEPRKPATADPTAIFRAVAPDGVSVAITNGTTGVSRASITLDAAPSEALEVTLEARNIKGASARTIVIPVPVAAE